MTPKVKLLKSVAAGAAIANSPTARSVAATCRAHDEEQINRYKFRQITGRESNILDIYPFLDSQTDVSTLPAVGRGLRIKFAHPFKKPFLKFWFWLTRKPVHYVE